MYLRTGMRRGYTLIELLVVIAIIAVHNSFWATVGGPSVTGETATMKVMVHDERTGVDKGEIEWAFAKEGSAWRIKSAPLP